MLAGKRIVLGVSGSIAAYKAVYLARLFVEARAEVWPVLTQAATRFVGPMTFSALTGHRAVTDLWAQANAGEIGHVELAHRADAVVLAPATADLIARVAEGRANDPLAAICLSTRAPLLVAPAMESGMWLHDATQAHVATLKSRGVTVVEPEAGALGSGRQGVGRLAEPEAIFAHAHRLLSRQDLTGRRVLVTAGPTRERLDPVRFLTNASSGRMGYALAHAAWRRGAEVVLVSGPTELQPPIGVTLVRIETAAELLAACEAHLDGTSALLMAAAPADHRPRERAAHKLKKSRGEGASLALEENPDILRTLDAKARGVYVVGFAAETEELEAHASDKLTKKGLDLIVANDVTQPGAGFGVETNAALLLGRNGDVETLPLMRKEQMADAILDRVVLGLES